MRYFQFNSFTKRALPFPFIVLLISISCACSRSDASEKKEADPVINVVTLGAAGNGLSDDTRYFQKAIDSAASLGGGTVWVPRGKYLIDADESIRLKSNVTLLMADTNTQLITKPTSSERFVVVLVANVQNVKIISGKIIGERYQHLGTTGEWGMGIAVYGSSNVSITGTSIRDCWGDGIVVGGQSTRYNAPNASSFVTLKNVICNNNRRQGLTIGRVNNVFVDSCTFINTNGTKPEAGIDIEPDRETAENITIQNCVIAYNKGNGIEMYARSGLNGNPSTVTDVVVKNNFIHHNKYGGYLTRAKNVVFTHNRIIENKYQQPAIKAIDTVNCILNPNTYQ